METLHVRSYAKINLCLHVGGKRPDGFHELETVFQAIDLHDSLTIECSDEFRLTCSDDSIPVDSRNLVARAHDLLHQRHSIPPVSIHIEKRIPAGGGLGGGSSNAAATLVALRRMFSIAASDAELLEIALQIGSDVPFFVVGGAAYARGRGEELRELTERSGREFLLLLPEEKVSTPEAYRKLDEMRLDGGFPHGPEIGLERVTELLHGAASEWTASFRNDLESPVFALYPRLAHLKTQLYETGAEFALMSGSGSTLFGIYPSPEIAAAAAEELSREAKTVRAKTALLTT